MSEHQLDEDAVRQRAFEISQSEQAGTDEENWRRAEDELRSRSEGEPWAKTSSGSTNSVTDS